MRVWTTKPILISRAIRALGLAASFLCSVPSFASGPKPVEAVPIRVENGKLLGTLSQDRQVISYLGVPFAQPPTEQLRWKPPVPMGRWKGVLAAWKFGPHCIQSATYNDMVFHDPGPSEDCLTLNVWAPASAKPLTKKGVGLPVMVWVYGGGFVTGGTSENRQDGEFLAHRRVIVVSMNYRLGIFGFMAHPELTAESPNHASGNYGLMDQAMALAWVKRNAASFGGDPDNITIFGESAGSFSVSALMASPLSKDLFAKAIGESGAAFYSAGLGTPTREEVERVDAAWAERVFGSDKLFNLRAMSTDELLKAATAKSPTPPRFGMDIDGYFLPDTVPHIFADGHQAHVPTMGGWNANEGRAPAKTTVETFIEQAHKDFGAHAENFLAVYPALTDTQVQRTAGDYASDKFIAFSTWAWLEAQTKTGGAPVYRYFFALGSPGDRNHSVAMGAFHSDEIEYVFGALASRPEMAIRPQDKQLSEQMQQYWVNFAKTGDPNGAGLPKWPAYAASSDWQVMRLDAAPEALPDALRGRYLFLDSEWGKAAGK